jgi:ABC-type Fe3+/spermidine/putrescine transport system ATPase subunit
VYEPDLLLLDEPFSNLDAKLREQMRIELKLLQRRLGITVLFVTHDQIEALSLSDRIAVMQRGRVEQVGPPRSLYEHPASGFVRDFLGQTVILPGRVAKLAPGEPSATVTVELNGRSRLHARRQGGAGALLSAARTRHVPFARRTSRVMPDDHPGPDGHALTGVIEALLFVGDRYEARVALGGEHSILLLVSRAREWREGSAFVSPSRRRW